MISRYIDIHRHNGLPDGVSILAYSLGIDAEPLPTQGLVFSAGIHPWSAAEADFDVDGALAYLENAPVVAIGEVGLDYARSGERQKQRELLETQLEIATRRGVPVILHCVRAQNDLVAILKNFNALKGVVFHGYTGNDYELSTLLDRGYYISLDEASLRSEKTLEAIKKADRPTLLKHLFLETDMSDVTIESIYVQAAEVLDIPLLELIESIEQNYKKLFL